MSEKDENYEIEIKKIELKIKQKELDLILSKKKFIITPIFATIMAATIGMFATIYTTFRAKENTIAVEKQKLNNELILVAASAEDKFSANKLLSFWVEIGYLEDPNGKIKFFSENNNVPLLKFNLEYLNKAIELKVNVKNILEKSNEPYQLYKKNIENIFIELDRLYEFKKAIGDTTAQNIIEVMRSENKNLLKGYMKRWESKGILSKVFAELSSDQLMEAFDILIKYETSKISGINNSETIDVLSNN